MSLFHTGFEELENVEWQHGVLLWLQQYKAILVKRFHHARRSRKGFFSQILLPAIFVVVSMFVSLIQPPREGWPSLKLTTEMFDKPNYIAVNNVANATVDNMAEKLFKLFARNPSPSMNSFCWVMWTLAPLTSHNTEELLIIEKKFSERFLNQSFTKWSLS